MLLNNVNDIREWLIKNSNLNQMYFEIDNNTLEVSVSNDLYINFVENEIPIKFKKIEGNVEFNTISIDFNLLELKPLSLSFLPEKLNGSLYMSNLPLIQSSFDDWNVKYIQGNINFCGRKTSLTNLDFLRNTSFDGIFYLKVANTPFKDDKIPKEFNEYVKKNKFEINSKELMKVILEKEDVVLDFFNFENQNLEINKDK